VLLTC
jgi:hypothetical protein